MQRDPRLGIERPALARQDAPGRGLGAQVGVHLVAGQLAAGLGDVLTELAVALATGHHREAADHALEQADREQGVAVPPADERALDRLVVQTQVPAQVALVEAGGHPLGVGPRRHRGEQLTDRGAVVGTRG